MSHAEKITVKDYLQRFPKQKATAELEALRILASDKKRAFPGEELHKELHIAFTTTLDQTVGHYIHFGFIRKIDTRPMSYQITNSGMELFKRLTGDEEIVR